MLNNDKFHTWTFPSSPLTSSFRKSSLTNLTEVRYTRGFVGYRLVEDTVLLRRSDTYPSSYSDRLFFVLFTGNNFRFCVRWFFFFFFFERTETHTFNGPPTREPGNIRLTVRFSNRKRKRSTSGSMYFRLLSDLRVLSRPDLGYESLCVQELKPLPRSKISTG